MPGRTAELRGQFVADRRVAAVEVYSAAQADRRDALDRLIAYLRHLHRHAPRLYQRKMAALDARWPLMPVTRDQCPDDDRWKGLDLNDRQAVFAAVVSGVESDTLLDELGAVSDLKAELAGVLYDTAIERGAHRHGQHRRAPRRRRAVRRRGSRRARSADGDDGPGEPAPPGDVAGRLTGRRCA